MDLSQLSPSDAVVTLRGLERRYRGLFAGLGDDESPDDLAHRSLHGWSAVGHIVAAAPAPRPKPGARTGRVQERLSELGLDANAAADRIAKVASEDWDRTGTISGTGRTVTALDIARAAVDAGVTHLYDSEQLLATLRGRPLDDED